MIGEGVQDQEPRISKFGENLGIWAVWTCRAGATQIKDGVWRQTTRLWFTVVHTTSQPGGPCIGQCVQCDYLAARFIQRLRRAHR